MWRCTHRQWAVSGRFVERKYLFFSTGRAFIAFSTLFLAAFGVLLLMAILAMKFLVFVSLALMLAGVFIAYRIDSNFSGRA